MTNQNNAAQAQRDRYHILKTDPEVFQAVLSGAKTFEIRLNDRGYAVGDVLGLRETKHTGAEMRAGAPLVYTGRECQRFVSHVLTGYGLADGWCCLSFRLPHAAGGSAPVAGEVVAWAAVPRRGKRAGRIYCTCDTREQIDAYIEEVHQSNDSLTLWARPLSFADAAPPASAEPARILFPSHLRKMWSGGEVQAWLDQHQGITPLPATAKGSLARYQQWKAEQAQAGAPCSCPSGDGSLRHPCAVHPASATQPEQGERDA
ncbi:DUF3850 domain-containing protein [Achromobacter xylosoxidans]